MKVQSLLGWKVARWVRFRATAPGPEMVHRETIVGPQIWVRLSTEAARSLGLSSGIGCRAEVGFEPGGSEARSLGLTSEVGRRAAIGFEFSRRDPSPIVGFVFFTEDRAVIGFVLDRPDPGPKKSRRPGTTGPGTFRPRVNPMSISRRNRRLTLTLRREIGIDSSARFPREIRVHWRATGEASPRATGSQRSSSWSSGPRSRGVRAGGW